jgi:type I restriction enzyme S subunit
LSNLIAPLPPFEEQNRIVAKIYQLMSLCNELEARQQNKRESRAHINSAALDRMLAARAPEEFAEGWRRISDNFDLLYDAPENVSALRKAILQLAVMGKLVAQDENDESASILLEKILLEKERLIKDKIIKKPEILPPINIENKKYELPNGWEWIRLGQIAKSLRYGTSKHCSYGSIGSPVLRIPNLVAGKIDTIDLKFTKLFDRELDDLALLKGDILIIRSNGSRSLVGRSAVVEKDMDGYTYAGYLIRLRVFLNQVYPDYLHLSLLTRFVREQIEIPIRTTSGVKNINSNEISRLVIPLPPYIIQKRIVARVDQLMSLCDNLEAGLMRSQADSEKLMEAVVGKMLAG